MLAYFDKGRLNCFDIKMLDYLTKDRLIVCRGRLEYFDKGRLNCFDIKMLRSFYIKVLDYFDKVERTD